MIYNICVLWALSLDKLRKGIGM